MLIGSLCASHDTHVWIIKARSEQAQTIKKQGIQQASSLGTFAYDKVGGYRRSFATGLNCMSYCYNLLNEKSRRCTDHAVIHDAAVYEQHTGLRETSDVLSGYASWVLEVLSKAFHAVANQLGGLVSWMFVIN